MIQKTKNRKDTGKTLTLKESNPHSNESTFIGFVINIRLPTIMIAGTKTEINT